MRTLTLATLRHSVSRLVAPGIAVVLGVAFVATALGLGQTLGGSVRDLVAGYYTQYDAVVSAGDGELAEGVLDQVRRTDGVASAAGELQSGGLLTGPKGETTVLAATVPTGESLVRVDTGRMPDAPDEVAVSQTVASAERLQVGDDVDLGGFSGGRGASAQVVGVVDAGGDPRFAGGTPAVFGTHEGVTAWTGATGWTEVVVHAADGVGADEVTERLRAATGGTAGDAADPGSVLVDTGTEHADAVATRLAGGTDVITGVLLAFAVIALFVSALVIANTFAILLARRTRETALLRAVGATRAQVVRGALAEALATGVVFSALGTLLGVGLVAGLVAAADAAGGSLPELSLTLSAPALLAPFVVGVVVVLVAALRPVLRASAVAPLEALRPAGAVAARSRAGAVRIGLGLLLVVVGVGLLLLGWAAPSLAAGLAGGVVSFVGVLMVGSLLVPTVTRVVGAVPARLLGAPGRLAVGNAVANPRRAAATASALLVGVTLVTTTAVGARTAEASVESELDGQYAVDIAVTASGSGLRDGLVDELGAVDGVSAAAAVPGTEATVTAGGTPQPQQPVVGIDAGTREVLRAPERVAALRDGVVLVAPDVAQTQGIADGDAVTLRGPDGRSRLTADVDEGLGYGWAVTGTDLARLDGDADTVAAFLRLADGSDAGATTQRIDELVADEPVDVGGSAAQREQMSSVLDTVLYVVLGLLAVSVLIALVGIANTLSLSVLERTRESALLRALGTTRGQLRAMLAVESALLALVGVAIGTALGVGYGIAGAGAVLGGSADAQVVVPWGLLGGVALAAVVAALLAAVLPARRAVRVSPAAALAAE